VTVTTIVVSLSVFVLVYLVLAVVDAFLMFHYARRELAPDTPAAEDEAPVLHFTY
jgi:cytochrome bd-type quinol oxidase subunit 1